MADQSASHTSHTERGLRLERSPHPYARRKAPRKPTSSRPQASSAKSLATQHNSDLDTSVSASASRTVSPSDSGTEADDECFGVVKALPAPPATPSKGLKGGEPLENITSPSQSPRSSPRIGEVHNDSRHSVSRFEVPHGVTKFYKATSRTRHHAETVRRRCEVLSLGFLACLCLWSSSQHSSGPATELLSCLLALPLLLFAISWIRSKSFSGLWRSLGSINAAKSSGSFDPAPLLYPYLLPALVVVSLQIRSTELLTANVILGISALPSVLFRDDGNAAISETHWICSLLPLVFRSVADAVKQPRAFQPLSALDTSAMSILYPLHRCLRQSLQYLTSTSLLPSELELLCVGLIDLLMYAVVPTAVILCIVLWVGGVGLLMLCYRALKRNVALERIPRWRFKRAGTYVKAANTFLSTLAAGLGSTAQTHTADDLHDLADKDLRSEQSSLQHSNGNLQRNSKVAGKRASFSAGDERNPPKLYSTRRPITGSVAENHVTRRVTVSSATSDLAATRSAPLSGLRHRRKGSLSSTTRFYLSMSPGQAHAWKLFYAAYAYIVTIFLILIPIRMLIAAKALNGHEPFGWAIGYLFGDISLIQNLTTTFGLGLWIPLPQAPIQSGQIFSHLLAHFKTSDTSSAFTSSPTLRLCLLAHFVITLGSGLLITFLLSPAIADVDTRRKTFHFTMVVLLLPSVFLDPPFLALALSLVVCVFLLLEVIRAAQLRPFSRPLARFLAPYVDGRDLRGPVVVSHIFLAIGCAIPLWLALAGVEHNVDDEGPWAGWTAATRDVSMVAGVICVGMGDAAASLVGRRFGRHKWLWPGGKSLEGSAAFAIVVTAGLVAAKAYLRAGKWPETYADGGDKWLWISVKALIAACGASFTEAVLTGCNDNVVVPVILWLYVRSLKL